MNRILLYLCAAFMFVVYSESSFAQDSAKAQKAQRILSQLKQKEQAFLKSRIQFLAPYNSQWTSQMLQNYNYGLGVGQVHQSTRQEVKQYLEGEGKLTRNFHNELDKIDATGVADEFSHAWKLNLELLSVYEKFLTSDECLNIAEQYFKSIGLVSYASTAYSGLNSVMSGQTAPYQSQLNSFYLNVYLFPDFSKESIFRKYYLVIRTKLYAVAANLGYVDQLGLRGSFGNFSMPLELPQNQPGIQSETTTPNPTSAMRSSESLNDLFAKGKLYGSNVPINIDALDSLGSPYSDLFDPTSVMASMMNKGYTYEQAQAYVQGMESSLNPRLDAIRKGKSRHDMIEMQTQELKDKIREDRIRRRNWGYSL